MRADLDSYLSQTNAVYIAELLERFRFDPASVDPDWTPLLQALVGENPLGEIRGASWSTCDRSVIESLPAPTQTYRQKERPFAQLDSDSVQALLITQDYRQKGHLSAQLDPLAIRKAKPYPFQDAAPSQRALVKRLQSVYCGTIGFEYMHLDDQDQKNWLQKQIENGHGQSQFTAAQRRAFLERLTAAEGFEKFLGKKYQTAKRFSLEGGESLLLALEQTVERGAELGVREVVLGMAHRGRLNVLHNFMQSEDALKSFEYTPEYTPQRYDGYDDTHDVEGSDDVKYHRGASGDRLFAGEEIRLSLAANPSHLEAVGPVIIGRARSKQEAKRRQDKTDQRQSIEHYRQQVIPIIVHGDAAFAGQGLVAETFLLSRLDGYKVGGCIHLVVNNQIGFTTDPSDGYSGPYPTEIAKAAQAPIFHVNGDDVEAVVRIARLAVEFRQMFNRDVVVDIFCYRRLGHNETDNPDFTQPSMYQVIRKHPTTHALYAKKLMADGICNQDDVEQMITEINRELERKVAEIVTSSSDIPDQSKVVKITDLHRDYRDLAADWGGLVGTVTEEETNEDTSISEESVNQIAGVLFNFPESFEYCGKIASFTPHRTVRKYFEDRQKRFQTHRQIDWATAEALAIGSLLKEGIPVRLSGQDSSRGTFSHRHAVLYDQNSGNPYTPLQQLGVNQARFEVVNSPLSEAAVLGFEHGYASTSPNQLVLWEAQFGDFCNNAQVIIDQFISSSESKWQRCSGMVLLLPHGYDGNGPEHSSGRIERFLQLCASSNMRIANCSTPASYFHILRRQIYQRILRQGQYLEFRKPLVIFTPKLLLRHPRCLSSLADIVSREDQPSPRFKTVLPAQLLADPELVTRVILCSGQIYYALLDEQEKRQLEHIAIVRLEQIYPFPYSLLRAELNRYPNARLLFWCQEEPRNMGAWNFVRMRMARMDGLSYAIDLAYAGLKPSAAPAVGYTGIHLKEQKGLIEQALVGDPPASSTSR